jgi:hypothetical protein
VLLLIPAELFHFNAPLRGPDLLASHDHAARPKLLILRDHEFDFLILDQQFGRTFRLVVLSNYADFYGVSGKLRIILRRSSKVRRRLARAIRSAASGSRASMARSKSRQKPTTSSLRPGTLTVVVR